jgi:hypothetical protein
MILELPHFDNDPHHGALNLRRPTSIPPDMKRSNQPMHWECIKADLSRLQVIAAVPLACPRRGEDMLHH